jgi:redox-sensing transcriptional repressor
MGGDFKPAESVPVPTLRRLPSYLRLLRGMKGSRVWVSCTHLASALDLDPTQVRKDLAYTGVIGRPKIGYQVSELVERLETFLGWQTVREAILVGAGNLGRALIGFPGFARKGLNIIAACDVEAARIGGEIHGRPVLPMEQLPALVARTGARLGVLTVPEQAAQQAAQAMHAAGITAIWNFTPVRLVMAGVLVEDVDLSASFAVLSHRLTRQDRGGAPTSSGVSRGEQR